MTTTIETVTLKNGAEEAKPLVVVTMMTLNRLMDEGKAMVVYELVELCKNPAHRPFGVTGDDMVKLSLASKNQRPATNPWHVHNSIRNIVLSAIEGEGMDLCLGNPVAKGNE